METRTRRQLHAALLTSFLLTATAVGQNPFQGFPPPAQPTQPTDTFTPEVTPPPLAPNANLLPPPTGINTNALTPQGPPALPDAPIPELASLATNRYILRLPVLPPKGAPILPNATRYALTTYQSEYTPEPQALFTLLAITHSSPSVAAIRSSETGRTIIAKAGDALPGGAVVTTVNQNGVTISNETGVTTLTLTRSQNQ